MLAILLGTEKQWHLTVLRLGVGIMILPHGLQKAFGLFGGAGFSAQMAGFTQGMHIPAAFAFLAIMAELLGGIGLILGLVTRVAAFGVACNMIVAVYTLHWANGFFMNWGGTQKGEGFEFHLVVLAATLALMMNGGGAASLDRLLAKR